MKCKFILNTYKGYFQSHENVRRNVVTSVHYSESLVDIWVAVRFIA